jgi:phosphatidylserine/phosphatidylglycerophosphate/cardiolipin synthase-like enzyme
MILTLWEKGNDTPIVDEGTREQASELWDKVDLEKHSKAVLLDDNGGLVSSYNFSTEG